MPWFKIDDGFHGHPKVVELSLSAVGLWTLAGSWCANYLTDGFVQDSTVRRLGGSPSEATELVDANLWLPEVGGFSFRDWADYQPLKADVEAERAAAQERMRKVRAQKKGVRENGFGTSSERSGEQTGNFGRSSEEVRSTPAQSLSLPIPTSTDVDVKPRKRGTRIPEPFIVTTEMRQWAADRTPGVDVNSATEKFVNHWRAATRNATKLDWLATWHNWLISDYDRRPKNKATPGERAAQTASLGRPPLATELIGIEE